MTPFPRDRGPDSTLALLRDGCEFIPKRCSKHNSDAFETRLMLTRAVCASGPDAARMFFHPDRFTRVGALPPTTLRLLQDEGSVSTLDGRAHRHRKQMFMSVLTPESGRRLAGAVGGGGNRVSPRGGRPDAWGDPEVFRPDRFAAWGGSPFDFVAQSGGDTGSGHRCPGERATIEVVKTAARLLAGMRYDVPPQDLRIDLSRIPAIPARRFVIAPKCD